MNEPNRRDFLEYSVAALASNLSPKYPSSAIRSGAGRQSQIQDSLPAGKKPLRLGLIIHIGKDPDAAIAKVRQLGLPTAQVFVDEF